MPKLQIWIRSFDEIYNNMGYTSPPKQHLKMNGDKTLKTHQVHIHVNRVFWVWSGRIQPPTNTTWAPQLSYIGSGKHWRANIHSVRIAQHAEQISLASHNLFLNAGAGKRMVFERSVFSCSRFLTVSLCRLRAAEGFRAFIFDCLICISFIDALVCVDLCKRM